MSRGRAARQDDARLVRNVWLASRAVLAVVCVVVMVTTKADFATVVSRWDADLFIGIAQHGYSAPGDVALFPGLPAILAGLARLGVPMELGGVLVSLGASALAAWALYRIGGAPAACLWLIAPTTVFTAVGYTEALFCAAAFWAWERARANHWSAAAMLAGLACGFRVSGLFLVVALGLLALTTGRESVRRRFARCLWLVIPLAVLGAYVWFLRDLTGSWTAWLDAQQSGWGRQFTWPWDSFWHTLATLDPYRWPGRPEVAWVFGTEIVSVGVGLLVTIISLIRREWGEAGWVGLQVLAFATSNWFISVNRAVLLWFPLFVLAGRLAAWRPRNPYGAAVLRVLVWTAVVVDCAVAILWAWLYFTGRWAS